MALWAQNGCQRATCRPWWSLAGWEPLLIPITREDWPHIASPGKDPNSQLHGWFLPKAYCFHTILKRKNPKPNHRTSGTACITRLAPVPHQTVRARLKAGQLGSRCAFCRSRGPGCEGGLPNLFPFPPLNKVRPQYRQLQTDLVAQSQVPSLAHSLPGVSSLRLLHSGVSRAGRFWAPSPLVWSPLIVLREIVMV